MEAQETLTEAAQLTLVGHALTRAANLLASLCGAPGAAYVLRGLADTLEREERERVIQ